MEVYGMLASFLAGVEPVLRIAVLLLGCASLIKYLRS